MRSSGGPVTPDVRLGVTLRLLAGGSYLDQMLTFRLGASTVFAVFKETLEAIITVLGMPGVPLSDARRLRELADGFHNSRAYPEPVVRLHSSRGWHSSRDTETPRQIRPAPFFCRKGKYALPVQACVDAQYRFLYMSSLCVGSTHDSVAFSVSGLPRRLRNGELLSGFWITGDAAYSGADGIVTPLSSSALRHEEDGV